MNKSRQNGAALVVALFLVVTLASIGGVVVRITAVQQHTVSLSLLSERALLAARSGIQWAAHRALTSGACAPASTALTEAGLNGFQVQIDCTSTVHAEGAATTTVYQLQSFAWSGAYQGPDYVSRRLTAVVSETL